MEQREARFSQIADGVWAQVEDRSAGLPRHLDSSAHEGRIGLCSCRPLLDSMTVLQLHPLVLLGTRLDCRDQHEFALYVTGQYEGLDLRLSMCRYCGTVEVRDVSIDLVVDHDPRSGRRLFISQPDRARRRDLVIGWYAGRRASGRTYR